MFLESLPDEFLKRPSVIRHSDVVCELLDPFPTKKVDALVVEIVFL